MPEKTILLAYGAPQHEAEFIDHAGIISLDGMNIRLSQEAVHLGVVRTIEPSNNSAITDRISAYKRQLYSLLPPGIALIHHGSPAASLRIHTLYCLPVLLSGLPSLVLSKSEVKILSTCFKTNLQRLMKLPEKTPDPAIYFLAGSLPLEAILHLRQLSLFSMICHMQNNVLKDHAIRTLTNKKDKSWFHVLRSICVQYDLPHPLNLLYSPPVKSNFKSLCKSKVHDYWHRKLSHDAQRLPSLCFMDPRYLSLSSPHPLWCSLDGNSYQSEAAFIQALFLSGRYRTEMLCRFWSQNVHGFCLICLNSNLKIAGTMEHILLQCDGLTGERRRLYDLSRDFVADNPILKPILDAYLYCDNNDLKMRFLLDCSVLPDVITAKQLLGDKVHHLLFKLTRTWCRSIHRARLRKLGR